ncbi:MAG: hypothetical protein ACREIV_00340, partial [Planctomycetaceae bacterium]
GAVRQMVLRWPNWRRERWAIQPIAQDGVIEQIQTDADGDEMISLHLLERRTGPFTLALEARRPIEAGGRPNELTLPLLEASSRLPALLAVAAAENVEFHLQPGARTLTQPADEAPLDVPLPPEFASLHRATMRIHSPERRFQAAVTLHEQEIETASEIRVTPQDDRLLVIQRLQYQVAYERLESVRLMEPEALRGRVLYYADADFEAPLARDADDSSGPAGETVLRLPEGEIGAFEVFARYVIDLPAEIGSQGAAVNIPVVRTADAKESSLRMLFDPGQETLSASLADGRWKPIAVPESARSWTTAAATDSVNLTLTPTVPALAERLRIQRALIRTVLAPDGQALSRAQYRFAGQPPAAVTLRFGAELELEAAWWNGARLSVERIGDAEGGVWRISLPESAEDGGLLTLDYRHGSGTPLGWSAPVSLPAPEFVPQAWIDQSAWTVALPAEQHLFTLPDHAMPQFEWQRDTVFRVRQPRPAYADLDGWIAAADGPPQRDELRQGNAYPFSGLGPMNRLEFRTMGRSFVVLIGAGLSLAAGFLLLTFPVTRHVLTLLAAVFAVALLGLWFAAPVQLLLQPALLGLALAVAAVLIDRRLKRRAESAVLTFPAHSDYSGGSHRSGSSMERLSASRAVVGSESPTAVRPVPASAAEPVSSQSGSRP